MSKKKFFLLLFIFLIPFVVNAETYNDGVTKSNGYINTSRYNNTYKRYLSYYDGSKLLPFEFYYDKTNKTFKNRTNDSFINGGFISLEEYLLTKNSKGSSYLHTNRDIWTLTSKDSNSKYIIPFKVDKNANSFAKLNNSSVRTKVTEFVSPNTFVSGSGRYDNPWIFEPMYMVQFSLGDRASAVIDETKNNQYVKANCKNDNACRAIITIKPNKAYKYSYNSCDGIYNENDKTLTVENVKRDTNCIVHFRNESFEVKLGDKSYDETTLPRSFFVSADNKVYSEDSYENEITKLTKVPTRIGYDFKGYYFIDGSTLIVEPSGIIKMDKIKNLFRTTLNSHWELGKYGITLDTQNGTGGTPIIYEKYSIGWFEDAAATSPITKIIPPSRTGYTFKGYYTGTNGSGTQVIDTNGIILSGKTKQFAENGTLYAYWIPKKILCSNLRGKVKCNNLSAGSDYLVSYSGNCQFICDNETTGAWRIKFLTTGQRTFESKIDLKTDVFLVGGGGNGTAGGGGGGGYTNTFKQITFKNSKVYTFNVGAATQSTTITGENLSLSVKPGNNGNGDEGGNGGSGGGGAALGGDGGPWGGGGGSYGSNGGEGYGCTYPGCNGYRGGSGQGYTTCEFGEGNTTYCNKGSSYAYSGGGGGRAYEWNDIFNYQAGTGGTRGGGNAGGGSGAANTGGGGGAGYGRGGSGIIVIRNKR